MRTFHEREGANEPFRLSYHGRSHYNVVVSKEWNTDQIYVKTEPGTLENEALEASIKRQEDAKKQQE